VLLLDHQLSTATGNASSKGHPKISSAQDALPVSCGWCLVERRLAGLCKEGRILWSASSEDLRDLREVSKPGFDYCCVSLRHGPSERLTARSIKSGWSEEVDPIVSPERLGRELAEGVASGALVFGKASDVGVASRFYASGFVKAFEMFTRAGGRAVLYSGLGWGSKEVPLLTEALEYLHEHCCATDDPPALNFEDNYFNAQEKRLLSAAVQDESRIWVLV
jgi:hypothetical protein